MKHSLLHDAEPRSGAQSEHPSGKALVLGGGGSAGNAWLIGVVAGLYDGGLDVTTADLIVGTSAGSTAAAQITGASPERLLADVLDAPAVTPGGGRPARPTLTRTHLERMNAVIADSRDAADMRRRMGAELEADAASSATGSDRWRTIVAARLPQQEWPRQRVLITAVDARTGEPVVFDRDSGVELADAVAASCAGGFAYAIGDRRYIDGGYRTNAENADLASGYEKVLVLSPFGGRTRLPLEWRLDLVTQIDELRAQGSHVEAIYPDADALAAFGDDVMDPASRPPAARAGHAHGASLAESLSAFWD
ncbi:patatin-like phospholipase family protein [Microbacterium sp. 4R-513]|uniref:patatin-like phospholipase family protein n=1 Tax=Microbacterium sp. 4R-513 TaxID=2567934 RepID=UPI0013E17644|nr:patatin-like phospholipase family protein [Microbacterium sp. 4R-513]QIG40752.1 patatin-like phospholipase family protein [Microbacterium sp. 4R-513]